MLRRPAHALKQCCADAVLQVDAAASGDLLRRRRHASSQCCNGVAVLRADVETPLAGIIPCCVATRRWEHRCCSAASWKHPMLRGRHAAIRCCDGAAVLPLPSCCESALPARATPAILRRRFATTTRAAPAVLTAPPCCEPARVATSWCCRRSTVPPEFATYARLCVRRSVIEKKGEKSMMR